MSSERQQQGLFPALLNFPRTASRFPSMWEDMFGDLREIGSEQSGLTVSEDKQNIYIEAALPGLKAGDIEVTLEDKGILRISGEKKEEEQDKDKRYYRRASTSFSYRLALPGQIDESKEPKATYQDGIMKITFTKTPKSQAKKITVK